MGAKIDRLTLATAFKVPMVNVTPFVGVMGASTANVQSLDLQAWVVQQAIVLADGFPRYVFSGEVFIGRIPAWDLYYQNTTEVKRRSSGQGIINAGMYITFDEIRIVGITTLNNCNMNGYLIDRLVS